MKTEQQQLNDMYDRVLQVFPDSVWNTLAPQQQNLVDQAINRVAKKDGLEAVTVPRLEGIKELATQHLWSGALSTASRSLPPSATETSETLGSTQTMSQNSEAASVTSNSANADLQRLPEDPALGAIRAMQSRLTEQSTTEKPRRS